MFTINLFFRNWKYQRWLSQKKKKKKISSIVWMNGELILLKKKNMATKNLIIQKKNIVWKRRIQGKDIKKIRSNYKDMKTTRTVKNRIRKTAKREKKRQRKRKK